MAPTLAAAGVTETTLVSTEPRPDPDLYLPPTSERPSRWEEHSRREMRVKKGWGAPHLKVFTPQCFSYFP